MKSDTTATADITTESKSRPYTQWLLWLCRLIVGGAFIASGWSKSIDPWGFIYKIEDYLNVWQINQPRELILCAAVALSCFEFITGVCVLCGILRRAALWSSAAIMTFMLPLSVYIAVANPVSDCGCFGDLWVISNTATLLKNILISGAVATLFVLGNRHAPALYRPAIQWIAITLSTAYILTVAIYGYNIQPMVDFRPYPTGTDLAARLTTDESTDEASDLLFVYSKDGVEQNFTVDNLPDSSWTFVRRDDRALLKPDARKIFGIYDRDGDDLSSELIHSDGAILLVVVADPGLHYLSRAHFINEIAATVDKSGGEIIGLIGAPWQVIDQWADLALPTFDIYSADDSELKSLVRGDAALVMLNNGKIVWKRTVASLDADFTDKHHRLNDYLELTAPDNGTPFLRFTVGYLVLMLITAGFNFVRRRTNAAKER